MKEDEIIPVITNAHCRMEAFLHLKSLNQLKWLKESHVQNSYYHCIFVFVIVL
jgi:hypothetical protein